MYTAAALLGTWRLMQGQNMLEVSQLIECLDHLCLLFVTSIDSTVKWALTLPSAQKLIVV
jgi:hypothetical protein